MDFESRVGGDGSLSSEYHFITKGDGSPANDRIDRHIWKESIKIGRGGDKAISALFGMDRKTIARGRSELLGDTIDIEERIRQKGAGRKGVKKNRSH